ncbi:MAG: hypothetical protein ACM3X0_06935 [Bacteroidota bacterium]
MNYLHSRQRVGALGAILLMLCLPAWWLDRVALLVAWLAAWCFCLGLVLGGMVSIWVHNLSGGAWGEAIRRPILEASRLLPWLSLFFLPVLAGLFDLYGWAAEAGAGAGRWGGELSAPDFKSAWLQPGSFLLRALGLLLLWNGLAWASRQPALERSAPFAAAALIIYGVSVGVAAVDWIMSLMPLWYSSIFGLEVATGQALSGLAFAVMAACRRPGATDPGLRRDLGNLLLTYVMVWAYTAFSQFLVIWSENLPHEISWYVARREAPWLWLGLAVVLFHFALPFLLLLFRSVKESRKRLFWVAAGLLGAHLLEVCWLILPSAAQRFHPGHLLWLLPLTTLGLMAVCYGLLPAVALASRPKEACHA